MSAITWPDQDVASGAIGDLLAELIARHRTFRVEPQGIDPYRDDDPDTLVTVTLTGYVIPLDVGYLMDWALDSDGTPRPGRSIRFPGRDGEPVSVAIRFRST